MIHEGITTLQRVLGKFKDEDKPENLMEALHNLRERLKVVESWP